MSPLRLRQYRAFHVLMQTGSVTRTAETLAISQPAVSKLLQALEVDIGVKLFDRSRRRLTPTTDAMHLHREVERLFLMASNVDRAANQIRSTGVGELRVAALPMLGVKFMPDLIGAFCRQHPGVRISLTVAGSRQVAAAVLAGQADLGFAHPASGDEHVSREPVTRLAGVAILPPGHRLAARRELTPSDLEDEPFISLGRENRIRYQIDGLFDAHSVGRELRIETNYCDCACEFVAGGHGVSIVDPFNASVAGARVVVKPISPTIDFAVDAVRPHSSSASLLAERFVRMARQSLGELDAQWRGVAPAALDEAG